MCYHPKTKTSRYKGKAEHSFLVRGGQKAEQGNVLESKGKGQRDSKVSLHDNPGTWVRLPQSLSQVDPKDNQIDPIQVDCHTIPVCSLLSQNYAYLRILYIIFLPQFIHRWCFPSPVI